MVVGANTARFQKRWLLVPATIGLCCVLFYYATDRLPASTAELQRNRKEMLALRAEMLKMQDSMARTAKPERHAAASTAELQKNRKEMLALLRAEMLKMKDSTATPNTGNIGVPETKIDVASGVADGAAPEGCVPCWIKPGLDSMDTIGEAYGRRTGHSTDKIGGGSYKWDERKGILKHGYDRWYEWFLEPLRGSKFKLFEIGLLGGASADLWRKYLPSAELFGMDYSKDAKNNAERSTQGEIRVFFGDQANPQHLDQLIVELGGDFDVIIDDGGHMPTQQITTFKHLFKKALRPGGVFIVEDYETSYWTKGSCYGSTVTAGVGKAGTWVEVSKHFIDSINRDYLDISRTASLFENRADSEIDFMFVARNFMAFIKNGTWKPSSQTSDGQANTAPAGSRNTMGSRNSQWTKLAPHPVPNVDALPKSLMTNRKCQPCIRHLAEHPSDNPVDMTEYAGKSRYNRWFKFFLGQLGTSPVRVLEIGLDGAESTAAWRQYMPNAQLFGMRKSTDQGTNKVEGMSLSIGDPANPQDLKTLISDTGGKFDVIVDTGGHTSGEQATAFKHLFVDGLLPGGVYFVTGTESSYHTHSGGGIGAPGTWIEISKMFVDTINRYYHDHAAGASVFENGADTMIDVLAVAPNWMGLVKKGTWDKTWDDSSVQKYGWYGAMFSKPDGSMSSQQKVDTTTGQFPSETPSWKYTGLVDRP